MNHRMQPPTDRRKEDGERMMEIYAVEDEIKEGDEKDEISFFYYGEDFCACSKNSMCKSNKCICFLRSSKCKAECHKTLSKCTNK